MDTALATVQETAGGLSNVQTLDIAIANQDSQTDGVYLMDASRFRQMEEIAKVMGSASLIPAHLRGNGDARQAAANCFLIVNQALKWRMDPFMVAPETYEMRGKLGFQGKLIAAVINTRAGIKGRLEYRHYGEGDKRTVEVSATFKGEDQPKSVTVSVEQAKTSNEMWKKDPDQKLCYVGAIKWARRYCPEIVLGVYTDDDLDVIAEKANHLPPEGTANGNGHTAKAPVDIKALMANAGKANGGQPATPAEAPASEIEKAAPVVAQSAPGVNVPPAAEGETIEQANARHEQATAEAKTRATAKANGQHKRPEPAGDPATTPHFVAPADTTGKREESINAPCSPVKVEQVKTLLNEMGKINATEAKKVTGNVQANLKAKGLTKVAELTNEQADKLINSLSTLLAGAAFQQDLEAAEERAAIQAE